MGLARKEVRTPERVIEAKAKVNAIEWVTTNRSGVCFAATPKVGSFTLYEYSGNAKGETLTSSQAALIPLIIAFMRDPLDRVHANFSYFYLMSNDEAGFADWLPRGIITKDDDAQTSYERFIDYLLSKTDDNLSDNHWAPQLDLWTHNGNFLPKLIYPMSRIDEVWFDHADGIKRDSHLNLPKREPHQNSATRIPVRPYLVDEVKDVYARDTAFYTANLSEPDSVWSAS